MKKALLLSVSLALAGALLVGCGSSGKGFSERASEGKERTFRYPIVTSPTTLDPHKVEDGDTIDLLQQVYEGLVGWNAQNEPVGLLAEKWEISADRLTYTFTLRKGVKFQNGREVTADDVKWSYERATNPKLASPVAATYLSDIAGVAEKLAGKAPEVSGIKVIAPDKIEFKLTRPIGFFVQKLTYLVGAVLPKESVPADAEITTVDKMVGTGPFTAKSYAKDQQFDLAANKSYWGGAPKIDFIERQIIKDPATRLTKYKNGEVDLVMLERQDVAPLQSNPKLRDDLEFFDRPAMWYFAMAPKKYEPFKNRDVRRAFAMAIDRQQIVNETLGGINKLADGILPPAVVGAREKAAVLPFDPVAAKALLAKAGYADGSKLPPLEMNFRDSRRDIQLVAENIVGQLKKNLGVNINLRSMEWGAYLQKRDRGDLQAFHMRWAMDYLDPENFLTLLLTTNGPENKMGYSNADVDRSCALADVMAPGAERNALYAKAEDAALQDAIWVPIYFQRDAELISRRVKGLRTSAFGHLPHTSLELTK